MRSSRGVLGLGLGGDLLLNFDQLAALAFGLFVGLLARLLALFARLLGLDHVDAHLAETSFSGVSSACGVALMLLAMGLQPAFGPRRIAVLPRRRYPKGMATPI